MKKGNKKVKLIIQTLVFIVLFLTITMITSKITAILTNDNPKICRDLNIKINDAETISEKDIILVNISNNGVQDINGFNAALKFNQQTITQKLFSTVKGGSSSVVKLNYNLEYGKLERIVITPIVIKDKDINYCKNLITYKE